MDSLIFVPYTRKNISQSHGKVNEYPTINVFQNDHIQRGYNRNHQKNHKLLDNISTSHNVTTNTFQFDGESLKLTIQHVFLILGFLQHG